MTDDEYLRFLQALAGKHLRVGGRPASSPEALRKELERLSSVSRLSKLISGLSANQLLLDGLAKELARSPLGVARQAMDDCGILDALDDVHGVMFRNFRRSAIPTEDFDFLRRADYSDDEIEVLVAAALDGAQSIAQRPELPSSIMEQAERALAKSLASLTTEPPDDGPKRNAAPPPEKKKRKTLNGIGKLLGGAIAGVGNVLLATGTIVAPNPATAYGAIASSGLAVASIFGGLGDLKGE